MFFLFDMVVNRRKMRKIGLFICLFWMVGTALKAQDPTLIQIAGKDIRLSEFLGYYHQSNTDNRLDLTKYFQRFVQYRLKVEDAGMRRMDTLPDFKRQKEILQAKVVKDYFTNYQLSDSYVRQWIEEEIKRQTVKGWVKIKLYTYRLSQHASSKEENNAVRIMDELYGHLTKRNASEEDNLLWIQKNAILIEQNDNGWIPLNSLLKEKVKRFESLELKEFSKPFYSPLGIHIICFTDYKDRPEPEDVRFSLEQIMDRQGIESPLLNLTVVDEWMKGNTKLPSEVQFQLNQIHDGLLAAYWDYQFLPAVRKRVSLKELEDYFQSHKKQYRWEYPHFKGAVIHCLDKKAASKIKKRLKKIPMELWQEALARLGKEEPDYKGELECGLFQIGKNAYVDRLAFKCGEFKPREELPYTFLVGKTLKKGPEVYSDVLQQVTEDCLMQRENDLFSQLFARFNVEIYEDVLKTVNSCGNK